MSGRILYILLLCIIYVQCKEHENQAKIYTKNQVLFIESAKDRNISFNLMPGSSLFVNNTNVLDKVKNRLSLENDVIKQNTVLFNEKDAQKELKQLREKVQRISVLMANSRRLSRTQTRNLSRALARVRRIRRDIIQIENLLKKDKCAIDKTNNEGPCKNGGICYNTYPKLYCECAAGWTGEFCEEDVNECYEYSGTDLACQNNAICVNTAGSYSCKCQNGFVGRHCRTKHAVCDVEQAEELCGHGVCVQAKNALGYTCICNSGWSKTNDTAACVLDVNECQEHINPCYAECINLPGSFQCAACPAGYTGNGFICLDIDECLLENGGCSQSPFVKCINTEGSNQCGNCPQGWTGDGRQCEQLPSNACDGEQICHPLARCEYISDTMVCTCPENMYGHGFGENGCTLNAIAHACEGHECKNNGTCLIKGRGTTCLCAAGYFGALCEQNEACNPSPCQNDGTCILLSNNNYRCDCPKATTGKNCEVIRDICGAVISEETGQLSYPANDTNYEAHESCPWIIRTANNKILNVTFTLFDIEASKDCNNDWLQIHDGHSTASQLIGRFCGSALPLGGSIISSQRQLLFIFHSNNQTTGRGFKFNWSSRDYVCGDIKYLTESSNGVIRSQGYPVKTPANRECEWQLSAPYGYRFVLRFYEINLGGFDNCAGDTLKIFDADMELKSFCETQNSDIIYTSSNKVTLHLHTDAFRADSSFQVHYEVEHGTKHCGGLYTEPIGYINAYVDANACLYLIQQPAGTQISLEIQNSYLVSSENCRIQSFEIFDGSTVESPLLKRICGLNDNLEAIISSGNTLLLRYTSSLPIIPLPSTFQAKYKRVCEYRFFGPTNGTVSTPYYPQMYINDLTCTYHIYAPADFIVEVRLLDFSMPQWAPKNEANSNTSIDDAFNYLDVYTALNNKQRFYAEPPSLFVSASNYMRLVLHMRNNSGVARGMKFEYAFRALGCGGIFTENKGGFEKTKLSSWDHCEWIIQAPADKLIKLHIDYARIGQSKTEDVDFVIYDNSTTGNGQILESFSGSGVFDDTLTTNLITIKEVVKNVQNPSVLLLISLQYEFVANTESCGGEFGTRFGVIKSPNWPQPYGNLKNCTWHLIAPLGHQIELHVHNFSLELSLYNGYSSDFLEIRNGPNANSPLIGKYSGHNIPQRIPSFTNHLYLFFYSDNVIVGKGFYMTWEQTATGCGGILNSHEGSIHSPHYQLKDTGAVACDWQITVSKGSTIQLSLTGTDLCQRNSLAFYDGLDTAAKRLQYDCTFQNNTYLIESSSNQVLLRYTVEDGNLDAMQFIVDYKTNCHVQIDSIQGIIESPNFPDDYPPHTYCVWELRGRKKDQFSLAFSHMKLESYRHCYFDYVKLVDMNDDVVLSEQTLCDKPTDVLTTKGNHVLLKFVSDDSKSYIGFRAEYKRLGCGDRLFEQYGIFESPNAPYSVDLDCEWYIEVKAGYQINLIFTKLTIETENQNCSTDGIVVSESKNSNINLLAECTVNQESMNLISPSNRLYIHFYSSDVRTRKYFSATYTTRKSICGGFIRGNSGYIASPSFLGAFQGALKCQWEVKVENGFGIELNFKEFNITESANCSSSYLEIKKYNTFLDRRQAVTLMRACGEEAPNIKLIHGDTVAITLKVADNAWGKFALNYAKQCGGIVSAVNGYIKSRMGEECEWTVIAPNGSYVSLDILQLECECKQNANCTNGLTISDQEQQNDVADKIYCKTHSSHITLPTSTMYVTAKNIYLRAKYSTVQNSCGGLLKGLQGTIGTSPEFYPSNKECIWEIKAVGMFIELNFEQLNISVSDNCNEEFVEVRAGEMGRLKGVYCGNVNPDNTLVLYEKVWIKYRTAATGTYSSFVLNWNLAHYNELDGNKSGSIESPPLFGMNEVEPYTWRILLNREQRVELNFKEYNKGLKLFDGFDETAIEVGVKLSPWSFISNTNVVFIKTDNINADAFLIVWKNVSSEVVKANSTINQCREIINLGSAAYANLSSPAYPAEYKSNLNCEWIIKSKDIGLHVVFKLYKLDLEQTDKCYADYLSVSISADLENWIEIFKSCETLGTGLSVVKEIHGAPYLKVQFHTDDSAQATGFTSLLSTACGSNITNAVGSLYRSSEKSTHGEKCQWQIAARSSRNLNINIEMSYNLTSRDACDVYAIVYDGVDEHAPMIPPGRICKASVNLVSSNNQVTVRLVNNAQLHDFTQWDFKLNWREINNCNEDIRLSSEINSVNISSPRYPNVPQPHTECFWLIVAPAGELLEVTFVDRFDLNIRYCDDEYVKIYDGSTQLAPLLGKYCYKPRKTIRSTGNVIYIYFITDIAEPRNGFRVNVSLAKCGGAYSEYAGEITSPNYPDLAFRPKTSVCDYHIRSFAGTDIRLNFTDINLPFNATNLVTADRIEIISLENNATIYGNTTTPALLTVQSSEVLLRYYAFPKLSTYRGFKLQFTHMNDQCYRTFWGVSGKIKLTNRKPGDFYRRCTWKITVPKGQRVKLDIMQLELEQSTTAPTNLISYFGINPRISIYNDFDRSAKIAEYNLTTSSVTAQTFQSTDNVMYIVIVSGGKIRTIVAQYSSEEDSLCPENIQDSREGLLYLEQSLKSLNTYYCRMQFQLNGQETISFYIDELEVIYNHVTVTYPVRFRDETSSIPLREINTNLTKTIISLAAKKGSLTLYQNDKVRITRFRGKYRRHNCGGSYYISDGLSLQNPDIDEANYGVLECTWVLSYGVNQHKLVGNVTFIDDCENEYLEIYGSLSKNSLITKLCRDKTQANDVILKRQYNMLIYHAENYKPKLSSIDLKLESTLSCGRVTKVRLRESLRIEGKSYKNNIECSWDFETTDGWYLQLQFTGRFFIEDSINCTKDYLELQVPVAGIWQSYQRICGREAPAQMQLSASRLRLIFHTNEAVTADGFNLVISDTCNIQVNVTETEQLLLAPTRSFGSKCVYEFKSNTSQLMRVRVLGANQLRTNCNAFTAFILSSSGEKKLGDYCYDADIRVTKYLKLTYDVSIGINFRIGYALDTCGGQISAPTIVRSLTSANYVRNNTCTWHITAPAEHAIIVHFLQFGVKSILGCKDRFVKIYEGLSVDAQKLHANLCGTLPQEKYFVVVNSNEAIIQSRTTFYKKERGFEAEIFFAPNCNEYIILSEDNANVTLAQSFNVNATTIHFCHYIITAPENSRISLRLKDLQISGTNCNSSNCDNCNYIEILDGLKGDTSLGKYCQNIKSDILYYSTYAGALIRLDARKLANLSFEISVHLEPSQCGIQNTINLDDTENIVNGIVFPTNNATQYPANAHCSWQVKSKQPYVMNFDRFLLQNVSQVTGNCVDYLSIKMDRYTNKYFCGNVTGYKVMQYHRNENTKIIFHSDDAYEDQGFNISFHSLNSCNRTFDKLNDIIYSFTSSAGATYSCFVEIRVPEQYSLTLMRYGCDGLPFKIIDMNTNETLKANCIAEGLLQFTTTNALRLEGKNQFYYPITYVASDRHLQPGCGGIITTPDIIFTNPAYDIDRNFSSCRWDLYAPMPNKAKIEFLEFDMGPVVNCYLDFMQIWQIDADGSEKLVQTFCGNKLPATFISQSNHVAIVSKKSPNFAGIGWKINFLSKSPETNADIDLNARYQILRLGIDDYGSN